MRRHRIDGFSACAWPKQPSFKSAHTGIVKVLTHFSGLGLALASPLVLLDMQCLDTPHTGSQLHVLHCDVTSYSDLYPSARVMRSLALPSDYYLDESEHPFVAHEVGTVGNAVR